MADSNNEIKAIEKISGVVGESQVKIILSNQCIKAQAFLVNRLKRQFERQKEVSKFISNDNTKLEAEIKNAEQEIKSLMLAHESIKSANVELMKEWQLAKESSQETAERVQVGEKKYDELWEQAKSRYESIGFVQNWLQATNKKNVLEEEISLLDKETRRLLEEIKNKEDVISAINKKRIIELAQYFTHEKPMLEKEICNTSQEIKKLNGQINQLTERHVAEDVQNKEDAEIADASPRTRARKLKIDDGWPNLNKNLTDNGDTLMPKLQLMNIDLDVMSVKLDQIKKSDYAATSPLKGFNSEQKTLEAGLKLSLTPDKQQNEYSCLYFKNTENVSSNTNTKTDIPEKENNHNYSKRKLINILEDLKLDKKVTYNILSNVSKDNLHGVSTIGSNANKNKDILLEPINEKINDAGDANIDEHHVTSNVEQIILPPSGFLDQLKSSQEKKKVSFELPTVDQQLSLDSKMAAAAGAEDDENEANVMNEANSPMDETAGSEESFTKIKDMILKKHNLDLSPQFVYGKNTPIQLKSNEVVRSNYFKLSCEEPQPSISGTQAEIIELPNEQDDNEMECDEPILPGPTNEVENETAGNNVEMDVDENVICSSKETQDKHIAKPVAGLLFNHGPLGLPDSLDASICTTGFEDGDAEYPQYSSLLMSPKADLPIPSTNENAEVVSQDVPNFLSGLRKTGLSFFGNMIGKNTENASAPTGNNNFNFAFGGDDKKSRGGLFNMFN